MQECGRRIVKHMKDDRTAGRETLHREVTSAEVMKHEVGNDLAVMIPFHFLEGLRDISIQQQDVTESTFAAECTNHNNHTIRQLPWAEMSHDLLDMIRYVSWDSVKVIEDSKIKEQRKLALKGRHNSQYQITSIHAAAHQLKLCLKDQDSRM